MKQKTIAKTLKRKHTDWIGSITDPVVKDLAAKGTIITGGCIASMLMKEEVNDYDLYFLNIETATAIAKYYVDQFKPKNKAGIDVPIFVETSDGRVRVVVKSAGIASEDGTVKSYQYFEGTTDGSGGDYVNEVVEGAGDIEDKYNETEAMALKAENVKDDKRGKYRPVFMSTNAITLSGKVQLVLRFFGNPEEIHENYDFVHCTNYWSSWDHKLVLRQEALVSLMTKELRYVGSKYPLCSIIRLRKFIARSWTINAGQILKMVMQVNSLDLKRIDVLQDQLTGVDSAYFCELMTKLAEKDKDKIDTAYLVEIIDRIF